MADETDEFTLTDERASETHTHGHPEVSQSYASVSESAGRSHPSPESSIRRPPPGFESRVPSVAQVAAASPKPTTPQKQIALVEEEFPALGTPKLAKETVVPAIPKMAIPKPSVVAKQATAKKAEMIDSAASSRRGSWDRETDVDDKEKDAAAKAAAITPRAGPKSLRVMTPAKAEAPSVMSPVASRIMSGAHRPDTPASETVSDSASIVSTSVSASRPGSPPPSRVGSAYLRTTTKSQQRKQRKDAMKQETKVLAEAAVAEEAEHAPVLGRKKKQKKEKPVKEKPVKEKPTPAATETEQPKEDEAKPAGEDSKTPADKSLKSADSKTKAKAKTEKLEERTVLIPTPPPPPAPTAQDPTPEDDEPVVPPQGPASVFEDIRQSLWTSALEKLNLIRPVVGASAGLSQAAATVNKPGACKDSGCRCGEIQSEDLAALESGKPVRKQCRVDGSRMLITPNGDCVRKLTSQEEDDFLELQASVASTAESAGAFTAPRHQTSSGAFSIIKGRAVPNGRPNIFPASSRPEPQDPFGKLQRDEALSYINQYVLPRLNLGASGKATPGGVSASAAATTAGNLGSLRDAAAASLNSLAPYFYGPEAAAGVGIYSAVDSNATRPVHDFGAPPGLTLGGNVDMVKGARGMGAMALMSVDEAEAALAATRKDTEKLEKGLNAVIKRNKRMLLGSD